VASEQELHAATRHPGITLASHTWTHPNLVQLPPAELEDELRRPLAWLRQRFERVIPWLSYPYGLASRAVEAAAAAAGYTAALVLEGGWCAPGRVRRYAVPRHGVPRDLSVNGFVLCTSWLWRHDAWRRSRDGTASAAASVAGPGPGAAPPGPACRAR